MNSKIRNDQQKKPSSVLQSDGVYFNRILSRESSVGQSSRIYYRRPEGVPFRWEMQPGTPKNLPEDEELPPLSPPPLVQSLGLPKPCVDQPKHPDHSKIWFWRKIKIINRSRKVKNQTSVGTDADVPGLNQNGQIFQLGDQSDGDFVASSNKSCTSSSSSSYSSNSQAMESTSNRKESVEGPFCCSQCDNSPILDEGDRKVYYCRVHETAENDGSMAGNRILCRVSSVDQSFRSYYRSSEGVPFRWEMQPGTPKHPPENELIPPPSPPPAVQSLGLPLPKLNSHEESAKTTNGFKLSRMGWFWINKKKMRRTEKVGEVSFRRDLNATESCCSDDQRPEWSDGDSVPRSSSASSVVVPRSHSLMKLSELRRDLFSRKHFCFNPRNP
ncbi:uncharacterized protein [Coffea arabica]|uniref:Uncharacterized protein n=1 Tax=Coffea arabica TaxID=13443 RepID=A0ABM4UP18_COFAR